MPPLAGFRVPPRVMTPLAVTAAVAVSPVAVVSSPTLVTEPLPLAAKVAKSLAAR